MKFDGSVVKYLEFYTTEYVPRHNPHNSDHSALAKELRLADGDVNYTYKPQTCSLASKGSTCDKVLADKEERLKWSPHYPYNGGEERDLFDIVKVKKDAQKTYPDQPRKVKIEAKKMWLKKKEQHPASPIFGDWDKNVYPTILKTCDVVSKEELQEWVKEVMPKVDLPDNMAVDMVFKDGKRVLDVDSMYKHMMILADMAEAIPVNSHQHNKLMNMFLQKAKENCFHFYSKDTLKSICTLHEAIKTRIVSPAMETPMLMKTPKKLKTPPNTRKKVVGLYLSTPNANVTPDQGAQAYATGIHQSGKSDKTMSTLSHGSGISTHPDVRFQHIEPTEHTVESNRGKYLALVEKRSERTWMFHRDFQRVFAMMNENMQDIKNLASQELEFFKEAYHQDAAAIRNIEKQCFGIEEDESDEE